MISIEKFIVLQISPIIGYYPYVDPKEFQRHGIGTMEDKNMQQYVLISSVTKEIVAVYVTIWKPVDGEFYYDNDYIKI